MVTLETLLDVVPVVSLVVVLTYYTLTVRNQNRTRQAQLLLSLHRDMADFEGWMRNCDLMNMDGRITTNLRENMARITTQKPMLKG